MTDRVIPVHTFFVKIAISVPDEVFEEAERALRHLKISRSRFYTQAAQDYLRKVGSEPITERLDAVYSKESSKLDPLVEALSVEVLQREKW